MKVMTRVRGWIARMLAAPLVLSSSLWTWCRGKCDEAVTRHDPEHNHAEDFRPRPGIEEALISLAPAPPLPVLNATDYTSLFMRRPNPIHYLYAATDDEVIVSPLPANS